MAQYLRRRHMHARTRQEQVRLSWGEIAGKVIAGVSCVQRIVDGVMYVHCATPVWAHTLSLRQREILAKIAEHVGANVIREVRFNALGARAEQRLQVGSNQAEHIRGRQPKVALTESQERRIAALGASVKDEGIRESFLRAARSAAMRSSKEPDESRMTQPEERSW